MNNIFTYHNIVYLAHVLIIGPFLLYFWYVYNIQKKNVSEDVWNLLLILVCIMILYHGYKFMKYNIFISS